jgi:hypothetical protein
MPRQPQWHPYVPSALATLRALACPVIDRAGIERLFHLHRRDAIRLMHRFGGWQTGKTFLINRLDLISRLEALQSSADYRQEQKRRSRLIDELERTAAQLRQANIRIPVSDGIWRRRLESLPGALRLEPGSLHVGFQTTEDLLACLMELAVAISNDLDGFRERYERKTRSQDNSPS